MLFAVCHILTASYNRFWNTISQSFMLEIEIVGTLKLKVKISVHSLSRWLLCSGCAFPELLVCQTIDDAIDARIHVSKKKRIEMHRYSNDIFPVRYPVKLGR